MDKHWVEDLFPPTFAYSIDELVKSASNETYQPETQSESQPKLHSSSYGQELYERVRIRFNADIEESRQKCVQVGSPTIEQSPKRQVKKEEEEQCIWNNRELCILRDEHDKAKAQLRSVVIQLQIVEKEKYKLERVIKAQEMKLRKSVKSLHASQQESKRLTIRCEHLEKELRYSNAQVKMLEDDVSDLSQDKRTLKKAFRDVQKELIQERRIRTDVELQLKEDGHKLTLEHIAAEDEQKLDYEIQIGRLYEELKEVQGAFEKEKREHRINKKALVHLRNHFASLPLEQAGGDESLGDRLTKLQM